VSQVVLHVDADAFFASVEQLGSAATAHEALDGQPVRLVGVAASGLSEATQPTLDLA